MLIHVRVHVHNLKASPDQVIIREHDFYYNQESCVINSRTLGV
jgi:hypothetical protein